MEEGVRDVEQNVMSTFSQTIPCCHRSVPFPGLCPYRPKEMAVSRHLLQRRCGCAWGGVGGWGQGGGAGGRAGW